MCWKKVENDRSEHVAQQHELVSLREIITSRHTHTHTHTQCTSASPTFFFLMAYCRQWLRVLVSSRLVDLRIISSTSVELRTHTHTHTHTAGQTMSDCAEVKAAASQRQHKHFKPNFSKSAEEKKKNNSSIWKKPKRRPSPTRNITAVRAAASLDV